MFCYAWRDATLRMPDIALEVGIIERAFRQMISDLEKALRRAPAHRRLQFVSD